MELGKVKLYNFSSYAGEVELDFSTSADKNIVLIGGNNGAGKTSLFTAIKLALYGPLCFRYQGKNAHYSARIKELMNHDAFAEAEVKTYVEIEVALPVNQGRTTYTVHREWNYIGQRVRETYWVSDGSKRLSDRERDYFQNYLFTVVPPSMFEFFFFDGEEISSFFSDSTYNWHIKNAILTLCGYDTFSIIKKFCDTYVGPESLDSAYDDLLGQLRAKEAALEELERRAAKTEAGLQALREGKSAAIDEKNSLEAQFKNSGGLSKNERDGLNHKLRQHEQEKNEYSKKIRDYVEGIMPFYITYDLSRAVDEQLLREERMQQYLISTRQLSVNMLENAILAAGIVPSEQAEALSRRLYDSISCTLCPEKDPEGFQFIHDLSDEQRRQVSALLVRLYSFDAQDIIRAVDSKKDAADKYEKASRQLRESLPSIDANTFFEKFNDLSKQIVGYDNSITAAQEQLCKLDADRASLGKELDALRVRLQTESKNKTAYLYTARISSMMDGLISDTIQEKFGQIERAALQMFREITHKDNFVDLMEIDAAFNISMYKKQEYTLSELYALADNVGVDELRVRLGSRGMGILMDRFGITSKRTLRKKMKKYLLDGGDAPGEQVLPLYKLVEFSQLSKGEKQVFLLSLYWAIIKSSGQNIPFIIDTPFARIDMEHRGQLTKLFFSSVSGQVIILSTDEEVVGAYHDIIADRIASEYVLSNEKATGHTSVRLGYFGKEGSV